MNASSIYPLGLVAALNLWIAWRYSQVPIGQDAGLWLLWGMTGARPYRDYVDCKPPGIHLWLWLLSHLTGRRLPYIQFLHHATIGGFAVAITALTGRLEAGLLFTALAQSSWLLAYHAWLEAFAAGWFALGLLLDPWLALLCLALAVGCNLKLGPSALVWLLLHQWWTQIGVAVLGGAVLLVLGLFFWSATLKRVWYGAVTVAARLVRWRQAHGQSYWPAWDVSFATPLLLVAPAVGAAVMARPDAALWTIAAIYVVVNGLGRVWRPYHWIPLAAVVAVAAPPEAWLILLAEWVASGAYLSDILRRTRPAVAPLLRGARHVGETLRKREGTIRVMDEYTQIYVYAGKPPAYGPVEQVEIRHVIPERRVPLPVAPTLLVYGPGSLVVAPLGYHVILAQDNFVVLARPTSVTTLPALPDRLLDKFIQARYDMFVGLFASYHYRRLPCLSRSVTC